MHPPGRYGGLQPAVDDGLDGQMFRQRCRHEGYNRRGADFRRRWLSQGLSGRTDDARRQDQPDLGRHQPDPAHRDLPPSARKRSMMSKLKDLSDALDGVEDGATIGLGGWIFNSQPMARS